MPPSSAAASSQGSTSFASQTFAGLWADAVSSHASLTFLVFEGPTGHVAEWTYGEFDHQVGRVGAKLCEHGVAEGSTVHLALTNCPTFVAVWLAANRLGATIVPSDPMGTTAELADHIDRTTPTVGFCSDTRADVYRSAAPDDLIVIEIDETDTDFLPFADRKSVV